MKPLFTLLLLFGALCGRAQTPETATGPQPLEAAPAAEHPAEADALQQRVTTWEKILARMPRISGYVQLGYEWSDDDVSTFFIKRVRLNVAGDILPKLDYSLQVEFAGTPKVVDAYLQYRPFDQLNIRLGQYLTPFTIENTEYAPLKIEFIDYALPLKRLMGINERLGDTTLQAAGRDLGMVLYGGFFKRDGYSILNYDLAVLNGSGLSVKDDNSSKDIAARLTLKPAAGLQISGSYYWGEFGADYLKRIRYSAGACYDRGPVVVRGEWIGGRTGTGTGTDLDSDGWYAMAGWRATRSLMAAARYDTFRENSSIANTRQSNYTVGLTWQPVKYLRCQLNYTYEEYASRDIRNRNAVAVMISGIF